MTTEHIEDGVPTDIPTVSLSGTQSIMSISDNIFSVNENEELDLYWNILIPKMRRIGRMMSNTEQFRRKLGLSHAESTINRGRSVRAAVQAETITEDVCSEDEKGKVKYNNSEQNMLSGIGSRGMVKFGSLGSASQSIKRGRSVKKVWGCVKPKQKTKQSQRDESAGSVEQEKVITIKGPQSVSVSQQSVLQTLCELRYNALALGTTEPIFKLLHGNESSAVTSVYSAYVSQAGGGSHVTAGYVLLSDALDDVLYVNSRLKHRGLCLDSGNQSYCGLFHVNVVASGVDLQQVLPTEMQSYLNASASVLEAQCCHNQWLPTVGRHTPHSLWYTSCNKEFDFVSKMTCYNDPEVRVSQFTDEALYDMGVLKGVGQAKAATTVNWPHIYTYLPSQPPTAAQCYLWSTVFSIQRSVLAYRAEPIPHAQIDGLHCEPADPYTVSQSPSFNLSKNSGSALRPATSAFHQFVSLNHALITSVCILLGYSSSSKRQSISRKYLLNPLCKALETRIAHSQQIRPVQTDLTCYCESIYSHISLPLQNDVPFHSIETVKRALHAIRVGSWRRGTVPVGMQSANLARMGLSSASQECQCMCKRLGMIGLGPHCALYEKFQRGELSIQIRSVTDEILREYPFLAAYADISDTIELTGRNVLNTLLMQPCLDVSRPLQDKVMVSGDFRSLLYTVQLQSLPSLSHAHVSVHPVYVLFVGAMLFSQLTGVGHIALYTELAATTARMFTSKICKRMQFPSLDMTVPLLLARGQARCVLPSAILKSIPLTPIPTIKSITPSDESNILSIAVPPILQPEEDLHNRLLSNSTSHAQTGTHIAVHSNPSTFTISRANISLIQLLLCNYMTAPLPIDPLQHQSITQYFDWTAPARAKMIITKPQGTLWKTLYQSTNTLSPQYLQWLQLGRQLNIPVMAELDRGNTSLILCKALYQQFDLSHKSGDKLDVSSVSMQSAQDAVMLSLSINRYHSVIQQCKLLSLLLHARMLQQCPTFGLPANVQFRIPYNDTLDPRNRDYLSLLGSVLVVPSLLTQYSSRRDTKQYSLRRKLLLSMSMQVLSAIRLSGKSYNASNSSNTSLDNSLNDSGVEHVDLDDVDFGEDKLMQNLLGDVDAVQMDELDIVSVVDSADILERNEVDEDVLSDISVVSVGDHNDVSQEEQSDLDIVSVCSVNSSNDESKAKITDNAAIMQSSSGNNIHTIPALDDHVCYNIMEEVQNGYNILGQGLLSLQLRTVPIKLRGCESADSLVLPPFEDNLFMNEKDQSAIESTSFHQQVISSLPVVKKVGGFIAGENEQSVESVDVDDFDEIVMSSDFSNISTATEHEVGEIDDSDVISIASISSDDIDNDDAQQSDIEIESVDGGDNDREREAAMYDEDDLWVNDLEQKQGRNIEQLHLPPPFAASSSAITYNRNALLIALSFLQSECSRGVPVTLPSSLAMTPVSLVLAVNQVAQSGTAKPLLLGGLSGQWHGSKRTGRPRRIFASAPQTHASQAQMRFVGKRKERQDNFEDDYIPQIPSIPQFSEETELGPLLDLIPLPSRALFEMLAKQHQLPLHRALESTAVDLQRQGIFVEQNRTDILNAIQQYKSTR